MSNEEDKLSGKTPVDLEEFRLFFIQGKITKEQFIGGLINAFGTRKTVKMIQETMDILYDNKS